VHAVGLHNLTHMHQLAQQPRGPRRFYAGHTVTGLSGRQMVTDRAYPADPLCDLRHLKIRTALAELLQAAEFVHMEKSLFHTALVVQMDRHPRMTLDPRHRFYGYFSSTHISHLL